MKLITTFILLIIILAIWLFPVIISFATWNFWYTFIYIIWWAPAFFLTKILTIIWDYKS